MRGNNLVDNTQWSRKKSWGVGCGIVGGIVAMLLLAYLSYSNWHTPVWHAAVSTPTFTTSQAPALTAEEQLAAQEKAKLGGQLALYGAAYNCSDGRNRTAKRIADLVVCPRYTATITFSGNRADRKPVIHNAFNNSGTPMITITYRLHEEWRTSEMTGGRYFSTTWLFKVSYHASVLSAGRNEMYAEPVAGRNSQWAGLLGVGEYFTNEFAMPDTATQHEIYGADKTGLPGQSLDPEKYRHP